MSAPARSGAEDAGVEDAEDAGAEDAEDRARQDAVLTWYDGSARDFNALPVSEDLQSGEGRDDPTNILFRL